MTREEFKRYLLEVWRAGYESGLKGLDDSQDFKRRLHVKINPDNPNQIDVIVDPKSS